MKPKHFCNLLSVTMATISLTGTLHAAILYWDGTDNTANADGGPGTWDTSTTANWDSVATAGADSQWTAANVASFGGTGAAVTVSGGSSAERLLFTASGYTLSGGTLALTSGTNGNGGETFNVAGGLAATVNSNITTTSGEVWLRGGGTLVLGGANTINGSLVISGSSTLEVADMAALGGGATNLYLNDSTGNTFRYTGASAALTRLSNFGLRAGGVTTFDVSNAASTMTMAQAFSNNSAIFAKTGGGTILFTGNNLFTGGVQIRQGTLQIGGAAGAIASQAVTVGNSTTSGKLVLGDASNTKNVSISNLSSSGTGTANAVVGGNAANSTLTVNTTTYGNFVGSIGGAGSNENNINLVKSGTGVLTLDGASTLTGKVTASGGALGIRYGTELGNPGSAVADQVTLNGGTLMNMTNATSLTSFGSGWSPTLGANVGITLGASGGTIRVGYTGKIFTVNGAIAGSGSLTKSDSSTLLLMGNNSYSGGTAITGGTLEAGSSGALATSGTISFGGGALRHTAANTTDYSARFNTAASQAYSVDTNSQTITWAGDLTSSTGSLAKSGLGTLTLTGNNTFSGRTVVQGGGTLEVTTVADAGGVGSLGTLSSAGASWLGVRENSTLRVTGTGNQTTSRRIWNDAGTGSGTFDVVEAGTTVAFTDNAGSINRSLVKTGTGALSLAQVISGTAAVTANGGMLTLSGNNSYSGGTSINAGADLRINGAQTGVGTVTVAATGQLGGTGSVIGGINVSGVLAPGNSIESLGGGALTFATGSTYAYELQTNLYDGLPAGAGDLTYSSGSLGIANGTILTLTDLATSTALVNGSKLTLISSVGVWSGGLFTYLGNTLEDDSPFTLGANQWLFNYNDITGGVNYTGNQTGATSFVTMTVVPETDAALLGGLGLLFLLRRRR